MARDKGYSTQKREKIMQYLQDNRDRTVTIGDIVLYLQGVGLTVNISTIYRYLEKLEQQGLLLKTVNGKREQSSFQYIGDRDECHNHLHMKCQMCGTVFHLDCGFMEEIAGHIMKEHGFSINCQDSYLTGICAQCTDKDKRRMEHCGCKCGCEEIRIHRG
jgi:Fur family ferric uptake transcriptional regulator